MHKILRYIRQNRAKLIGIVVFILFAYTIIRTANEAYIEKGKDELESSKNQVVTIERDSTVNLSDKNCIKIINEFLNSCSNGKYEDAYSYLSKDCIDNLYNSVEDFENDYCIAKGINKKGYSVKKSDISQYTYIIEFNNMLSSGKANTTLTYDYYTITVENKHDIKLNINSFVKTKNINKSAQLGGLKVVIQSCNIYKDYQEIVVTFFNDNENAIKIGNNVYVVNESNKKITQSSKESKAVKSKDELVVKYKFYQSKLQNLNKLVIGDIRSSNALEEGTGETIEIDI